MDFLKLRLNLQFFSADDTGGGESNEEKTDDVALDDKKVEEVEETFTKAQVEAMIKSRVSRAEKDKQKAIDEAEKLAGLNAEEKQKYEFEKLQKENEELKLEKNRYSLGREATKMLSAFDIVADDDVLNFVVREDAESTKEAVQTFSALIQSKVDDAVKKKLQGTSPKAPTSTGGTLTRESINAIRDSATRIKAIQDNPHLFN